MNGSGRKERVTLKTVAEKAGVSVATVSLILSGRTEWLRQFHPETIARVQQCAKRLGYRANLFATGLPMKTSSFFSLVLEDMSGNLGTWHHWAFEGSLLAGVVRAATEKRLYPVVATAHHETDETGIAQIGKIINGGVFGSIVRSPNPALEKFLRSCMKQGHPVVVVFPKRLANWPTNAVDVDNVEIGRMAGRLLQHRGRTSWMLIRFEKLEGSQRLRSDGFLQFAQEAGVEVHAVNLQPGVSELTACNAILPELRRHRPDGLFAVDSVSSVGATMAAVEHPSRPGQDIDILGCDCAVFRSKNLPTITSIDISWREVGVFAIQKLVKVSQQSSNVFETVLLPPRVQPGATCPVPSEMDVCSHSGIHPALLGDLAIKRVAGQE